jgi:hypothetical protein
MGIINKWNDIVLVKSSRMCDVMHPQKSRLLMLVILCHNDISIFLYVSILCHNNISFSDRIETFGTFSTPLRNYFGLATH